MPANAVELLIALFLAHFILDFPLQPLRWVADRHQKHAASVGLYLHALAHGLATALCFWALATNLQTALLIGCVISVAHFFIDLAKSFCSRYSLSAFVVDQLAHWLLLVLVWSYYAGHEQLLTLITPLISAKSLLLVLSYVVVLLPVSIVVTLCLRPWIEDIKSISDGDSLAKAGAMIGYLERILVLTFILAGNYTAIGFVLALKTAFRFKDTEERRKAEYMMMGTFLSFTLTIAIGLFTSTMLKKL